MLLTNNQCWDLAEAVDFFNNTRDKIEDVYPSEWFFLKDLLKEELSVLDIGCAQGGFSNVFARYLKKFSYTGIDISLKMIKKAKERFPQHQFFHINDGDYSPLKMKEFDLVLALGILHLHEGWRTTISEAWKHTKKTLLIDLRESFHLTIEDKNSSYFKMMSHLERQSSAASLPYNIINSSDALKTILELCKGYAKVQRYSYMHPLSEYACSPLTEAMATVYCVQR